MLDTTGSIEMELTVHFFISVYVFRVGSLLHCIKKEHTEEAFSNCKTPHLKFLFHLKIHQTYLHRSYWHHCYAKI